MESSLGGLWGERWRTQPGEAPSSLHLAEGRASCRGGGGGRELGTGARGAARTVSPARSGAGGARGTEPPVILVGLRVVCKAVITVSASPRADSAFRDIDLFIQIIIYLLPPPPLRPSQELIWPFEVEENKKLGGRGWERGKAGLL